MVRHIFFPILCAFAVSFVSADAAEFRVIHASKFLTTSSQGKSETAMRDAVVDYYSVNKEFASQILSNSPSGFTVADFPVSIAEKRNVVFKTGVSAMSSTEWVIGSLNGDKVLPPQKVKVLKGYVLGEAGASIFMSVVDGDIYYTSKRPDGTTHTFMPSNNFSKPDEYAFTKDAAILGAEPEQDFLCSADEIPVVNDRDIYADGLVAAQLDKPLLQVEVVVEVDAPIYTRLNNDEARVRAYVTALMNMVSAVYEDQVSILITVPRVRLWTSTSDAGYPGYVTFGTNMGGMLGRLAEQWRNVSGTRDLVHLLTSITGGTVGGIAYTGSNYLGSVCSSSLGYGVSGLRTNAQLPNVGYVWDVHVVTHELGHNFSSPHTHNCDVNTWPNRRPLDTCVTRAQIGDACAPAGTPTRVPEIRGCIMSYCHLLDNTRGVSLQFYPVVEQRIRTGVERGLNRCVTPPANPIVLIQYPLGNNMIEGGIVDSIKFATANVDRVNAEYSIDGGNTWVRIASDVAVASRRIAWTPPSVSSENCFVRVFSSANASVGDTSHVAFDIRAASIRLLSRPDTLSLGKSESYRVEWAETLVDDVRVELSLDGGKTWTVVNPSLNGTQTDVRFPGIESTEAIIRVVSNRNNQVFSQTIPFNLKSESVRLNEPKPGWRICVGRPVTIRWNASNISSPLSRLRIQFSLDDGRSWSNGTASALNPAAGSFNWTVPATVVGANIRLRLIYLPDTSVLSEVGNITSSNDPGCSVLSVVELSSSTGYGVYPNPVSSGSCTMVVPTDIEMTASAVSLVDKLGRTYEVRITGIDQDKAGKRLSLDVSSIAAGAYTATVRVHDKIYTSSLQIVR